MTKSFQLTQGERQLYWAATALSATWIEGRERSTEEIFAYLGESHPAVVAYVEALTVVQALLLEEALPVR